MNTRPIVGIRGSKARLPKPDGNGSPAGQEELARLSEEYFRTRNDQMRSKAAIAEMELQRRRGTLIDKKAVSDTVRYTLACFQRRVLLSPRTTARRLVTLGLVEEAKEFAVSEVLLKEAHDLLGELANLSEKAANRGVWLEDLARKELGIAEDVERQQFEPPRDQQEKARVRHEKRMEAQRQRRSR
jgi:hypothetical protein